MGHPPSDHHEPEPQDTSADAADPSEPAAEVLDALTPAGDAPAPVAGHAADREPPDLDTISADLDGVEAALRRLDEGTYWTDEVTGEPIADEVLADDPIARRAGSQ